MSVLSPKQRLEHLARMQDAYGYGEGLDKEMDNYGYGGIMVGGAKKKSTKGKRAPSEYNLFVGKHMKKGMSMAEAAKLWNKMKGNKKSKSGSKSSKKKVSSGSKSSKKKKSSKEESEWIKCERKLGNRGLSRDTIKQAYNDKNINCKLKELEKLIKGKLPKKK